jgi:hypothetical protein
MHCSYFVIIGPAATIKLNTLSQTISLRASTSRKVCMAVMPHSTPGRLAVTLRHGSTSSPSAQQLFHLKFFHKLPCSDCSVAVLQSVNVKSAYFRVTTHNMTPSQFLHAPYRRLANRLHRRYRLPATASSSSSLPNQRALLQMVRIPPSRTPPKHYSKRHQRDKQCDQRKNNIHCRHPAIDLSAGFSTSIHTR